MIDGLRQGWLKVLWVTSMEIMNYDDRRVLSQQAGLFLDKLRLPMIHQLAGSACETETARMRTGGSD